MESCAIYSIQVAMWLFLRCNSGAGGNYLGTGGVKLVISLITVMAGNRQKWNR